MRKLSFIHRFKAFELADQDDPKSGHMVMVDLRDPALDILCRGAMGVTLTVFEALEWDLTAVELRDWVKTVLSAFDVTSSKASRDESGAIPDPGYVDNPISVPNPRETETEVMIDGNCFRFHPSMPTVALPGSPQKLAILMERAERRQALWNNNDLVPKKREKDV